jgi:hypothetical protein
MRQRTAPGACANAGAANPTLAATPTVPRFKNVRRFM